MVKKQERGKGRKTERERIIGHKYFSQKKPDIRERGALSLRALKYIILAHDDLGENYC